MTADHDPADDEAFREWFQQVSDLLEARIGLDANDLPDFPSRAYFDSELSPPEAIEAAIEDGHWEDLAEVWESMT